MKRALGLLVVVACHPKSSTTGGPAAVSSAAPVAPVASSVVAPVVEVAPASSAASSMTSSGLVKTADDLRDFAALSADGKTIALAVADGVVFMPLGADHGEVVPAAQLADIDSRLTAGAFAELKTGKPYAGGVFMSDFVVHSDGRLAIHFQDEGLERRYILRRASASPPDYDRASAVYAGDYLYLHVCEGSDHTTCWVPIHASATDDPEPSDLALDLPAVSADGKTIAVESSTSDEGDSDERVEFIAVGGATGEAIHFETVSVVGCGHDSRKIDDDGVSQVNARLRAGGFKPLQLATWNHESGDDLPVGKVIFHRAPSESRKAFDVVVKRDGKQIGEVRRSTTRGSDEVHAEAAFLVSDSLAYLRYGEGDEESADHWLPILLGGARTTAISVGLPAVSGKLDQVALVRSDDVVAFLPMGKIDGDDLKTTDDAAIAKINERLTSGGFKQAAYDDFRDDLHTFVDELNFKGELSADKRTLTVTVLDGDAKLAAQKITGAAAIVPRGVAVFGRMFVYVRYNDGGAVDRFVAIPLS